MTGIYMIENIENGKVYVGQSKGIAARWKAHLYRPFNDNMIKYNERLYEDIRKYGITKFNFRVIEQCDEKDLNEKEAYWINELGANTENGGYNLTSGGDGAKDCSVILLPNEVDEIKDLLLNTQVKQWDIAMKYGVNQATISYINTGDLWNDSSLKYPLRKKQKKEYRCIDCGCIISKGSNRCVNCNAEMNSRIANRPEKKDLLDTIMLFNGNFTKVAEKYGVTDNGVRKWCSFYGLPRYSKQYKKDNKQKNSMIIREVDQMDINTKEIVGHYKCANDAYIKTGIPHIGDVCNGVRKTAGGYMWKYSD